jgi:hypothetical protein
LITGPQAGDLGDWHAVASGQASGSGSARAFRPPSPWRRPPVVRCCGRLPRRRVPRGRVPPPRVPGRPVRHRPVRHRPVRHRPARHRLVRHRLVRQGPVQPVKRVAPGPASISRPI